MLQGTPNCQYILQKKNNLKNMLGPHFLPKCDKNTLKTYKPNMLPFLLPYPAFSILIRIPRVCESLINVPKGAKFWKKNV